ncbi:hypothetical protein LAZ67_1007771 [Cordylochernes scorpioides]|uniref:Ig-like domain-containing protein n=1 Tax=Cordylochernes scorpioides TaxID=51811 RepID=A0ABY6JZH1_9ARAC|nr:hypothetical protein LAZ67_1007771 [Cordylochernes scorpioides]
MTNYILISLFIFCVFLKQPCLASNEESPQIQPLMLPNNFKIGDKISLTCIAFKGQPPFSIKWFKNDQDLDQKSFSNVKIVKNDQHSRLFFEPVASNSGGNYTCEMSNKHGKDTYTIYLNIQAPPEWLTKPQDVTALEGASSALQCQAKGSPTPRVTWTKLEDVQKSPGNSSVLVFNPVERVHAGKYRCTADNGLGPPLQHTVTLTVHCE